MYRSPRRRLPSLLSFIALALVLSGSCNDTDVTTVDAAQVSISPLNASVKVGETTKLTASVLSSDGLPLGGRPIQWSSLDETVAIVDNTGLVLGVKVGIASIRASAEGTSGTAQVTVTSGPALQATPATVAFTGITNGASPGDRTVVLTNIGDGTLNGLAVSVSYPAGGPANWLTATLAGTTAPATLVLGATLGSLAVGTYSATVTITSPVASNSPIVVPVQLQVMAPAAAIALSANTASFNTVQGGGSPAPQAVTVTNAGGSTLSGLTAAVSYASGQPTGWLSAVLGATTAPASLTLTAAAGSLPAGSYSATVRVASGVAVNSPQDITVIFTVGANPPVIGAQPASLTFAGVNPAAQQVQLTNAGGGALTGLTVSTLYSAGQPTGWLTATLGGGTAPASLTVSASGSALTPGNYTATVRVSAPGAANSPRDIPVAFTVPAPSPAIAVGANTVGFNAIQGASNPAQQTVAVTNAGGGTLSGLGVSVTYATGQPTGWLNASLGATTAPANITLTAATGTLPAGSYSATVGVTSSVAANSPQNITVTFNVSAAPAAIGRQPTSLTFTGVTPPAQQIQVTNTGGGTLTGLSVSTIYPAGAPSGWLTASLNVTTAPATITVTANGAALASGSYTATVRIAAAGAANSPVDVAVQLTVPPPAIALGLNAVGFSAVQGAGDPTPQTVPVTNAGGGTLTGLGVSVIYAPGQSTGWLSAGLGATTAPTGITLTASIGALQAGSYSATVRVASSVAANSPQDIPVTFTVGAGQPVIGAQPAGLVFNGVSPAPQQILITNRGGGTVSGISVTPSYASGQPTGWLNTSLTGTTAPATLTVSADGAALPPGSYSATLQIDAAGALNSPLVVPITFTVPVPAPAIALATNAVGFNATQGAGDPAPQTVAVTNSGGGTLSGLNANVSYGAGQPTGWLNAGTGSTAPTDVTLTAATGSLPAGTYNATVQVTSGVAANSPQNIAVTFTVSAPPPAITLGTNTAAFTAVQGAGDPAPQTVTVTNSGGGTLSGLGTSVSYGGGQPTGWLGAALGTTSAPTDITLTAATGSLAAGTYNATVQVSSGVAANNPQNITVTFTVNAPAPAVIGAQPTSLTFNGAAPADQQIQITNTGGGTLSGLAVSVLYASGQPTGWLGATPSGTTAPATITVSASSSGLAAGTYNGTVQISAAGATNSPVDVAVTFTVPETAPAAPTNVSASASSASQIDVAWTAPTGNVTEYRVERKTGVGGTYAQVHLVSGSTTGVADTGLSASTEYFYRVLACNTGGCSAPSTEASATTQAGTPNSPTTLGAQSASSTAIDLQWLHDGLLVTHFEIERAPGSDPTNFQSLTTTNGLARNYQDTGLSAGTTYVYQVRACALVICSAWSNAASATTPVPAPPVPGNVSATPLSSTQVSVAWDAVAGATDYRVRRQNVAGGAMTQTFTVAAANTTFVDSGLTGATDYLYSVQACNQNVCSVFSAQVGVTTQ